MEPIELTKIIMDSYKHYMVTDYPLLVNLEQASDRDRVFRQWLDKIENEYGFSITISDDLDDDLILEIIKITTILFSKIRWVEILADHPSKPCMSYQEFKDLLDTQSYLDIVEYHNEHFFKALDTPYTILGYDLTSYNYTIDHTVNPEFWSNHISSYFCSHFKQLLNEGV